MKYGFYRRLFEVDILLLIVAALFFTVDFLSVRVESPTYLFLSKMLIAATCLAFLANSKLFAFLQSRFPALKRYVIRSILVACLLAMAASSDVSFSGGMLSYFQFVNLVIAVLLIGFAKIAAMLGI